VTGGHDQACGALGVGLTRPGLAMVSTGTAEVVEVVLASPILNETLHQGNISVYAHVVPDHYLAMTLNHSGGLLLRWFRDTFCQEEMRHAKESGQDAYDIILEGLSSEPSPLMVLPHFAGSGTPWFDTQSKGAILGLTFGADKSDLVKAILEGLTFELRVNLDLLKESRITIDELRAIGGGARSELWLQLKADITGIKVAAPAVTEAAGLGAALLAGEGAGIFDHAAQAAEDMLELKRSFVPDAKRAKACEERYAIYRQIYPTLTPINDRL
jgi:xylulokinase